MISTIRRVPMFAACLGSIAFGAVMILAPAASAQTMGEYGGTLGGAASSAGSMQPLQPRPGFGHNDTSSDSGGSSTHTEVIRTDDSNHDEAASNDTGDTTTENPGDNWVQVKPGD